MTFQSVCLHMRILQNNTKKPGQHIMSRVYIFVFVCNNGLIHLCSCSPASQVVFAATSCPSQSSPPTAGCGLSSAAAATGWEKVSPPFMRVSAHSRPPSTPFRHVVQLTERMVSHTFSSKPASRGRIRSSWLLCRRCVRHFTLH